MSFFNFMGEYGIWVKVGQTIELNWHILKFSEIEL